MSNGYVNNNTNAMLEDLEVPRDLPVTVTTQ